MIKAFSWVVIANLARQVTFLAVNAVLFSRLSRPTFGALAVAFGYAAVFSGLGEFGIRQIGWQQIARYPERAGPLAGTFLCARTTTAVLSVLIYVLLMPVLWDVEAPATIYLFYAISILLPQTSFAFAPFGLNRIDVHAKYSLVAFSAYLAACVLLVTGDGRAALVPLFFGLAMGLLLLLEVRWLRAYVEDFRLRLRVDDLGRILRSAWPLGIAETINRLALSYPVLLLGAVAGAEGAGNYRIAEIGYSFVAQFGLMFASAGFSRLANIYQHDRARAPVIAARMLSLVLAAALVAGIALTVIGPRILPLLFDDVVPETLTALRLLGIALVFAAPARFLRGLLASVDEQRSLMLINAFVLALGLALGWWAAHVRGITGMAASLILVEGISLPLLLAAFWRGLR